MHTRLLDEETAYTGAQLRSRWIAEVAGLAGDAAIAFLGPCDVAPEHMVDLEDLAAGAKIWSRRMLHFIAEHADADLGRAALRQRLLVVVTDECLRARGCAGLRRSGDDLFWQGRKLSVSIATTSPTSGLIHLGLNVVAEGAPVPAAELSELGVDAGELAEAVMAAYAAEVESIAAAQRKARPVE